MESSFSEKKSEKEKAERIILGRPILTQIINSKKSSCPKVHVVLHPVKNTHDEHHINFFTCFGICTSQPVITITLLLQLQWICES